MQAGPPGAGAGGPEAKALEYERWAAEKLGGDLRAAEAERCVAAVVPPPPQRADPQAGAPRLAGRRWTGTSRSTGRCGGTWRGW